MAEMSFAPPLGRGPKKKDQQVYLGIPGLGDPFSFLKGQDADSEAVAFPGSKEKMVAAVLKEYGPASNLEVKLCNLPQLPGGKLRPTEVVVQVHAASVNPTDWKQRRGTLDKMYPLKLPAILGMDFSGNTSHADSSIDAHTHSLFGGRDKIRAGRVVRAGENSVRAGENLPFTYGDEVFGRQTLDRMREMSGCYAEYVVVDTADVCLKPKNLTHEQAAAVPHACLAAYAALAHVGQLQKKRDQSDRAVLILGGSGGVGSFAVQLARHYFDCHVVATCSPKNFAFVSSLGANHVIDYSAPDFLRAEAIRMRRFDVVVDTVGGDDYWTAAKSLLKMEGVYVTLVGNKRYLADEQSLGYTNMLQIKADYLVRQLTSRLGATENYHILTGSQVRSSDLPTIAVLLEEGILKVPLHQVFTLYDIQAAHVLSESHHAVGKIVIQIRSDPDEEDARGALCVTDDAQGSFCITSIRPLPSKSHRQAPRRAAGPSSTDGSSLLSGDSHAWPPYGSAVNDSVLLRRPANDLRSASPPAQPLPPPLPLPPRRPTAEEQLEEHHHWQTPPAVDDPSQRSFGHRIKPGPPLATGVGSEGGLDGSAARMGSVLAGLRVDSDLTPLDRAEADYERRRNRRAHDMQRQIERRPNQAIATRIGVSGEGASAGESQAPPQQGHSAGAGRGASASSQHTLRPQPSSPRPQRAVMAAAPPSPRQAGGHATRPASRSPPPPPTDSLWSAERQLSQPPTVGDSDEVPLQGGDSGKAGSGPPPRSILRPARKQQGHGTAGREARPSGGLGVRLNATERALV